MDVQCSAFVSELVLSARNEIVLANDSSTFNFESLSKLWEMLPMKGRASTRESEQFMNVYYSEFLTFLLSHINLSWLDLYVEEKLFENIVLDFIMHGSPEQSFLGACKSLKNLGTQRCQFQKVIEWICKLMESNCVYNALSKKCQECLSISLPDETFQEFIQFVSSLPDLILGQSREISLVNMFYQDNYSFHISKQIVKVLSFCHERLLNNCNVSVVPVSKLIGKMCMSGYGQSIWKYILSLTEEQLSKNALWKRLLNKTISNLDDWCIDCTIDPLIVYVESPKMMADIFGNLPLNNWKLEKMFTEKFMLNRYLSDLKIPKRILLYLISDTDRRPLFDKVFINVLKVWRQKTLLKYQPFEQTYYLCQVILMSLHLLRKEKIIPRSIENEIDKTVLEALPNYLNSLSPEIRQMGMIVGQSLALHGKHSDIKLELPIEDNHFSRKLLSLLEDDCNLIRQANTDLSRDTKVEVLTNNPLDSDDDDDLNPLPDISKVSGPTYLGQCIEGLSNYDDHKNMEDCLRMCGVLIKRYPDLSELDVELCKRLICLEDRFNIDNFAKLKNDALVALIKKSPQEVALMLIEQFYDKNYSIQQRLDILDILILGARALSFSTSANDFEVLQDEMGGFSQIDKDWKEIVKERVDLKTRRFTKGQSKVKPKESKNMFLNCAGWFFYPLLKNFERKEYLDMQEDHLLLEKLLTTLTTIIYCSINSPTSGNMAKTLLQFGYNFRLHSEAGVRKASLQAICVSFIALDAAHSLNDVAQELHDLCSWLNVLISKDSDVHLRQFSEKTLPLLNSLRIKSMQ